MDNTFIFFWNPEISDVTMDFYDSLLNVRGNGCFIWHTHDHQYAKYGDKAFLFIRGEEKKGICASGILTGKSFMDYEDSTPSKNVFNVKMEPWVMIHPDYQPILTLEELQKAIPDFDWLNSPSGSTINSNHAEVLIALWSDFIMKNLHIFDSKAFNFFEKSYQRSVEMTSIEEALVYVNIGADGYFHFSYGLDRDKSDYLFNFKAKGTLEVAKRKCLDKLSPKLQGKKIRFHYNSVELKWQGIFDMAVDIASQKYKAEKEPDGLSHLAYLSQLANRFDNGLEKIAVFLKDTGCSQEFLMNHGFPVSIVNAVVALTRKNDESFKDYIERLSLNELAKNVKLEDLRDKLNIIDYKSLTKECWANVLDEYQAFIYLSKK